MKNFKIPFVIVLFLLVSLGIYSYNQNKKLNEVETALKELQEISIFATDSIYTWQSTIPDFEPFILEEKSGIQTMASTQELIELNNEAKWEVASAKLDLEAEDIINSFDLGDNVYLSVPDALDRLSVVAELSELENNKLCRIAMRMVKRTKCDDKIKVLRDKLSHIEIADVTYNDGELGITGPKSRRFVTEISKVNLLIKTYEARRKDLCDIKGICDQNYVLIACSPEGTVDKSIYSNYSDCTEFFFDNAGSKLIDVVETLAESIDKYSTNVISEEVAKALFNSKFEKATDQEEDEEEEQVDDNSEEDSVETEGESEDSENGNQPTEQSKDSTSSN